LVADDLKANAFNNCFTSVCVTDDGSVPSCDHIKLYLIPYIDSVTVSDLDIMSAVDYLKYKYSCGPDGLPPALFKHLKLSLLGWP